MLGVIFGRIHGAKIQKCRPCFCTIVAKALVLFPFLDMFSLKLRLFCLCFVGVLFPVLHSQTCVLSGRVVNTSGEGLGFVTVGIHELHKVVISDSLGFFKFDKIKRGHYHFHASHLGHSHLAWHSDFNCSDSLWVIVMDKSVHHLQEFTLEEGLLKMREDEFSLQVEVAERSYLRRQSGQTFVNQIDRLPGVNVMNTGMGIAKPVLRGFAFNRVAVVDKGIRQEGQQWGWDHGLEIDPFDIERAEIIKGPSSVVYGSDAIGGVIGIRLPEMPEVGLFSGSVKQIFNAVNDLYGISGGVKSRTEHFFLAARISHQRYGDYRLPADSFYYNGYKLPLHGGRLKNTAGEELSASGTFGYLFSGGYSMVTVSRVQQKIGFFSGAHGLPTYNDLTDDGDWFNMDFPRQLVRHDKIIWNTNLKVGRNWIEADLGYQHNRREEQSVFHAHGLGFPSDPNSYLEHGFDLRTYSWNVRYHIAERNGFRWIFGSSGQQQSNLAEGFSFLLPNFSASQGGLWGMLYARLNRGWNLSLGLRGDLATQRIFEGRQQWYNEIGVLISDEIKASNLTRHYGNIAGSLGLNYSVNTKSNMRFHFANSFRLPTMQELSANGVHHGTFRHEQGDTSLKAERGYHVDFSYDYSGSSWKFNVAGFGYYFDRFIYLNPTGTFSPLPAAGQLFRYSQANAFQGGGELSFDWHPLPYFQINSYIEGVLSYNFTDGYPLPFIPPWGGGTEFSLYPLGEGRGKWKDFYVQFTADYAAPQTFIARNEFKTPGYLLFHTGAGVRHVSRNFVFDLNVSVFNLGNSYYFRHVNRYRILNLPEAGRNFSVSLLIQWNGFYKKQ
jgi:iron complex outermembrane receptor protein